MAFVDPDEVEQDMGVRVEEMFPAQLVSYYQSYHELNGIHLAVQDPKDRKTFEELQRIYTRRDAGRIVKWVTYRHKGQHKGKTVLFSDFCKARKWWTDIMHIEMQKHLNNQKPTAPVKTTVRVVKF